MDSAKKLAIVDNTLAEDCHDVGILVLFTPNVRPVLRCKRFQPLTWTDLDRLSTGTVRENCKNPECVTRVVFLRTNRLVLLDYSVTVMTNSSRELRTAESFVFFARQTGQ